jgi:hypothetical protein
VLGILFAYLSAWVLAPVHAGIDPQIRGDLMVSSISADFQDYCGAMGMYQEGVFDGVWPTKRSRGAAVISGELLRWASALDALSLGAVVCAGLVGAGLYIWGRVLGGPHAGVASVLLGLGMSPMPLL